VAGSSQQTHESTIVSPRWSPGVKQLREYFGLPPSRARSLTDRRSRVGGTERGGVAGATGHVRVLVFGRG